ncbi:MAG: hypothetical protein H6824_17855 [Planctomycetaceae bacterium]|nr:hypothetical protein [Planctomycetaceae bacterium]
MSKVLSRESILSVLRCLVEGNSIRSTERITGVSRNAVMNVLLKVGNACGDYLDARLKNLPLEHVQMDEIWTFVGKKENKLTNREKRDGELGSQYLFLGIDTRTKLIASYRLGRRSHNTTKAFVNDLESRLHRAPDTIGNQRPQVSTDGWKSYVPTIEAAFKGEVRHGVLIKNYKDPAVGRYAPPELTRATRINIKNVESDRSICTSHVERHNLTIRTFLKRFTRLALGFSKKIENLRAAISLHVAHYNFCWKLREKGTSGKLTPTPAEQIGITEEKWTIEKLYDTVMEHQDYLVLQERLGNLAKKLGLL